MVKREKIAGLIVFIALVLLLIPSIHVNAAYNQVWSDEFDGTALNTSNWVYETGGGGWGNHELEYYTNRTDNVSVSNGNLVITAKKESYGGMNYTSGRIKTQGLKSWTYGKVEARIKIPKGQGIWPAFWMLGNNISSVGWPLCGEIDVMEHVNNEDVNHGTMHWDSNGHASYGGPSSSIDVTQYHTYSIEWNANEIKWFVDGNQYWVANIANSVNSTEEFHRPFFVILNLAVGGDWPGSPDAATTFPASMYVDYVRVYQDNGSVVTPSPTPTQVPVQVSIPGQVEAENFSAMSGIDMETCSEGGKNVGWIEPGDWMDYTVNVQSAGSYKANFRVAGVNPTGTLQLQKSGTVLGSVTPTNTGDWQSWTTVSTDVNLSAGVQTLRVYSTGSAVNLNYINFVKNTPTSTPTPTATATSKPTDPPVSYTIDGYIDPDFTYTSQVAATVRSGFKVEISGTSYSATTDGNGYYKISGIPLRTNPSTMNISKSGYLTRTISNVIVDKNLQFGNQASPLSMWAGDMNQDSTINMADIMLVAGAFNTTSGDANYKAEYDFNKDTAVNMADIMIIIKHFNMLSSSYPVVSPMLVSSSPTSTATPTQKPSATPTQLAITIPEPVGNGVMVVQVQNGTKGAYADNQIYWCVIGKNPTTDQWSYLDLNGYLQPISSGLNDAAGHLTKNGQNYANIYHSISEKAWVSLPLIKSGRMFISNGSPLYIKLFNDGYASPDMNNTSDPNNDIYWDFVEFTVDAGGYHGNTTRVDAFGFPITHRLICKDGYDRIVGETETRAAIFTAYQNEVPAEFKTLVKSPYRIVAPCKGGFNTGGAYANYFDSYINEIWNYYTTHELTFKCDAGTFSGHVVGNDFVFSQNGGAYNLYIHGKPTSQAVFLGYENLATGTDMEKVIQAQICAAFNRHILGDPAHWADANYFYKTAPANYYALFWHKHSIDGLAYGFCYDDVNGYAAYLEHNDPKALIINVGW